MVFILSILIGIFIGIISAYYLRTTKNNGKKSESHQELTILSIIPWVSYLIAEGLTMSGIVSIIFCGITMARYTIPNVVNI